MNYNSIQEILDASTANMEVIVNNVKNDDGTQTVTGVDWFTFKGTVVSTIYASGNSWIGFGTSSEHLKVNRRDGAMYYLYREEGTLYNYYKFLKIRWGGYSYYSQTSSSYLITYDVILWDTGDISVHMINIPTSNNNGTYSLVASSTYSYTVSSSSPDVTFTKTDSGFTVNNSIINLELPFDKRYLIRNGSDYYTIINNMLSAITVTELTSEVFLNNGIETIPDINLLLSLSNPELLYWQDSEYDLQNGLTIKGAPPIPQEALYEKDLTNIIGIDKIETTATNDVLFLVSTDKTNYKYYNGSEWLVSTSNTDGMTLNTFNSLSTSALESIFESNPTVLVIKCILPALTSYVNSKIYVNWING